PTFICADTFFSLIIRAPPLSTFFPYTTLFRSRARGGVHGRRVRPPHREGWGLLGHAGPGGHESPDRRRRREPGPCAARGHHRPRSEEHTSELQSRSDIVCRLLPEKKKFQSVRR